MVNSPTSRTWVVLSGSMANIGTKGRGIAWYKEHNTLQRELGINRAEIGLSQTLS